MPRRIGFHELASVLSPDGLTLVSGCSAESAQLADMVETAGAALGDMTFCGVAVDGLNRRTWRAVPTSRVLTFLRRPRLSHSGRAFALIEIAGPLHRPTPAAAWAEYAKLL